MRKMTDNELVSLLSTAENQAAEYSGEFSRGKRKVSKSILRREKR